MWLRLVEVEAGEVALVLEREASAVLVVAATVVVYPPTLPGARVLRGKVIMVVRGKGLLRHLILRQVAAVVVLEL
jgi:hypothetical protein